MDIQFYGANCISLATKNNRFLVDDNLVALGTKSVEKPTDICLYTSVEHEVPKEAQLIIDTPGEYEVGNVSIYGIAARSHLDTGEQQTATIYKFLGDDLNIVVLGHIYPELNDEQLEAIGMVDVLIVPVGGHGYTLDAAGAIKIVREIEPKLLIPTHFADSTLKYPMPQDSLEDALKVFAMQPKETVAKLKVKSSDLSDTTQLIVLSKS